MFSLRTCALTLLLLGLWTQSTYAQSLNSSLSTSLPTQTWQLGAWSLNWDSEQEQIQVRKHSQVFLANPVHQALLTAAAGEIEHWENRGSFQLELHRSQNCTRQSIEQLGVADTGGFFIQGKLLAAEPRPQQVEIGSKQNKGAKVSCGWPYRIKIRPNAFPNASPKALPDGPQLADLQVKAEVLAPEVQYLQMHLTKGDAPIYGGGVQPSLLNLDGQQLPLLVQEGGIGRGSWPISSLMALVSPGSQGHTSTSYFPLPLFWQRQPVTSSQATKTAYQAWQLLGYRPGELDFRSKQAIHIGQYSQSLQLQAWRSEQPLELLSRFAPRQALEHFPDWLQRGAVVGMQGGSANVRRVWAELQKRGTPISALWLQDWVGRRKTVIGSQLWWNWELQPEQYPQWSELRQELSQNQVRLLGYINPFLVDVRDRPHERNLYQEAASLGYLLKDASGEVYPIQNTDFAAGMLDLSSPAARAWLQVVLTEQMVKETGFSGWMADYAEALPLDSQLNHGNALDWHNRYPSVWARVQAEAIQSSGCTDCFFFARSGYLGSLQHTPLFWLGDQMTDWSAEDGLGSALTGLLSGGLSGVAVNHSDAGGYTSVAQLGIVRSRELLYRWLELNTFTALLRTHEGNQPEANLQIYSDADSLDFFDRMARIYALLYPYRKKLLQEAQSKGWPVVRPLLLHYPDTPELATLQDEFLLGPDILVAPVLQPGQTQRRVRLPPGTWVHLWSGQSYTSTQSQEITVSAPLGEPPVFYLAESWGVHLRQALLQADLLYSPIS